jgi:hypothetical protein
MRHRERLEPERAPGRSIEVDQDVASLAGRDLEAVRRHGLVERRSVQRDHLEGPSAHPEREVPAVRGVDEAPALRRAGDGADPAGRSTVDDHRRPVASEVVILVRGLDRHRAVGKEIDVVEHEDALARRARLIRRASDDEALEAQLDMLVREEVRVEPVETRFSYDEAVQHRPAWIDARADQRVPVEVCGSAHAVEVQRRLPIR